MHSCRTPRVPAPPLSRTRGCAERSRRHDCRSGVQLAARVARQCTHWRPEPQRYPSAARSAFVTLHPPPPLPLVARCYFVSAPHHLAPRHFSPLTVEDSSVRRCFLPWCIRYSIRRKLLRFTPELWCAYDRAMHGAQLESQEIVAIGAARDCTHASSA